MRHTDVAHHARSPNGALSESPGRGPGNMAWSSAPFQGLEYRHGMNPQAFGLGCQSAPRWGSWPPALQASAQIDVLLTLAPLFRCRTHRGLVRPFPQLAQSQVAHSGIVWRNRPL